MTEEKPFIYGFSGEENDLVIGAEKKYGAYWTHARAYNGLLNNCIKEVKSPDAVFFVMFFSQVRKHHTLALLSIPRMHHVQTHMNFRQTIEAAANAAYGMAHYEKSDFITENTDGTMDDVDPSRKYKWLDANYKRHSDFLKKQKETINRGPAHSSTTYAFLNFDFSIETGFSAPFFDKEDDFHQQMDLWFAANLALGILDLFAVANQKYNLVELIPNFHDQQRELEQENHRLKAELGKNERVKRWLPQA